MSSSNTNNDNLKCQQQQRSLLLDRLDSLITQVYNSFMSNVSYQYLNNVDSFLFYPSIFFKCHNRFVNRYELATENDPLVTDLLSIIEEIFTHGLLTKRPNKILGRGK